MASTIPVVVPYFIGLMQATLPQDSRVWLGKLLGTNQPPLLMQVTGTSESEYVHETMSPAYKVDELYRINGNISYFMGDQDYQQRMLDVFDYWQLACSALWHDPTAGGNLRWWYPVAADYTAATSSDGRGSGGVIEFQIHCEQRITLQG